MDNMNGFIRTLAFTCLAPFLALTGCSETSSTSRPPANLSRTISDNGFLINSERTVVFRDEIMPPDQQTVLLSQENNPDADNVAFVDTTATLWKFYLER